MPIRPQSRTQNCAAPVALVVLGLLFGLLASGCSSDMFGSSASPPSPSGGTAKSTSFGDRMRAFFSSPSAQSDPAAPAVPASTAASDNCPGVTVRAGASTFSVGPQGADATPTNLRYQAIIAKTARECAILGATMTIKVGVQGRVILGPAGGPGQLDVPMRLALVREGTEPQTIWTKLYRIPVAIPPGQANVPFVEIEEDMTFPVPKGDELDSYVIYVGFDPSAPKEVPDKKRPQKPRRATG